MGTVYKSVDEVDLLVGMHCEEKPPKFGFSDTAFRIFILMASRRLKSDRFFTVDFRPEVYTPAGFAWVPDNSLRAVLEAHVPQLRPHFANIRHVYFPWDKGRGRAMGPSFRLRGLVDPIQADVSSDIRGLADDARLDRSFDPRGPLINRILVQRIRSVLQIDGMPLPSVAPRGDAQRSRAQEILRRRLDPAGGTPLWDEET